MSGTFDWRPERRRSPRVDLLADVQGHVVTLDEMVQVRQLGTGGMTIETSAPLSPRLVHDFRLTLGSQAVTVHGQVVHSRVTIHGDRVSYQSGVQFVDVPSPTADIIGRIIEEAGRA